MRRMRIGHLAKHPAVAIELRIKPRRIGRAYECDVFMTSYCPKRQTPLWRRVPEDVTLKAIQDYLQTRDAARFTAAGGVVWYDEGKPW